jgi:hypothetical protein
MTRGRAIATTSRPPHGRRHQSWSFCKVVTWRRSAKACLRFSKKCEALRPSAAAIRTHASENPCALAARLRRTAGNGIVRWGNRIWTLRQAQFVSALVIGGAAPTYRGQQCGYLLVGVLCLMDCEQAAILELERSDHFNLNRSKSPRQAFAIELHRIRRGGRGRGPNANRAPVDSLQTRLQGVAPPSTRGHNRGAWARRTFVRGSPGYSGMRCRPLHRYHQLRANA